ncbi:hypothetical protein Tco_1072126 [Tanacetum coccineum]
MCDKADRVIRDLQLEVAEGIDCLPNAAIFEQLTLMGDNITEEAINEENVPTHSNDPLLSGEDRLKLEELMALCTNLQNRVLDLEHTKTIQALEINNLKRRVKKLEKKQRSRTHRLRRLYKGKKIHDIDADEDITLENVHDEDMFDTDVFNDKEVFAGQDMAEKEVSTADLVTTAGEVVTTANVEVSIVSPTAATITTVELTLAKTLAELKSARPKTKGDKVETDYELAQRLQVEEHEELTIEEKSKLSQQLLEKRRKHFAAKRKPKDLKTKSFANVQELFDKAMKRVNTFVDMDTELVGEQEPLKKQKMEDDKETAELQSMMEVILDEEEVAVDAIPLATKLPSIVDWKIIKEGKIGYYQIIRADGNLKRYSSMI